MSSASNPGEANPASRDHGGFATLYFRRPRLLILTAALVVVSGLAGLNLLPRLEDPPLVDRFAIVTTVFPGADAERVEALVTQKIEDELDEIEEIGILESTSRTGLSMVIIELGDEVGEGQVPSIWSRIRDKLDDASDNMPAGALEPDFDAQEVAAKAWIGSLIWEGEALGYGPAPMGLISRLAEDYADVLRSLSGTQEVELTGEVSEELTVLADPARLAHFGLTAASLAAAIQRADAKVAAGTLEGSQSRLGLEVAGEIVDLDRLRNLVLRSSPDGAELRLSDVATIEKNWRDPPSSLALFDGRRGVAVAALVQESQRIDQWAVAAREVTEAFRRDLPDGVAFELTFDQSRYTAQRLSDLLGNLAYGVAGVMAVLFFLMGARAALLVGVALPLTSLMVLALMRFTGLPIHQMSVTGLIIALGLLIDNAIVMVDEVSHELSVGRSPLDAVKTSVRRLAVPLLGSTLTTVLAFMPIVLMPGPAGEFVGAIGVTVSFALVSSLFLSITIVASLAAFGQARRKAARPGFGRRIFRDGFSSEWLTGVYRGLLDRMFRHPLITAVLCMLPSLTGFWAAGQLEEQFFPPTDRDQFQLQVWMPQQSSLDETTAAMQRVEGVLRTHPAVNSVNLFVGVSAPKFYYNIPEGIQNASYYGQAMIQLEGTTAGPVLVRQLQGELDEALPEAQVVVRLLEQGPPFDAPVEVRLVGPDLAQLDELGRELRTILAGVPGVTHTRATLDADRPKLVLEADEYELARAGLSPVALAQSIQGLTDGSTGGSLIEGTEELPVRVRVPDDERGELARLSGLPVATGATAGSTAGASWTPLSSFGDLSLEPDYASIPHYGGERINTIQGFIDAGLLASVVLGDLQLELDARGFQLPPGFRMELGGESAERDDAVGNLMASVGMLVVLMAAILVVSFSSFRMAGIIALIAPMAVGLAMLALYAFGFPFGFMAIIGSMGLIGVAINDSIVVLAALRDEPATLTGDREVIRDVVVRASRHVFATTLTTMAGFLPLIIAGGQFWPPLAVAIGFGVLGATPLALGLVPSLYLLLYCRGRRKRAALSNGKPGLVAAQPDTGLPQVAPA
ncbi:MAG: efflux RND transporter permease subunit [Planctomycetota bacterium]|jgi:multidrug efflux pump subunit AcrB